MARSEDGGILIDGRQSASTLQCRHCGRHWKVQPGSGTTRGWCQRCSGPLCGQWDCVTECVPQEARLEYAEGTRTRYDDVIRELVSKGATLLCLVVVLSLGVAHAQNPKTAVYPGATAADKDLGVQVNHIQTTLAANITSTDTTASVNSCTGFVNYNYVAIGSEVALACSCSAGTMSFGKSACPNVDGRAQDGSAAASHTNGDAVYAYIVAANHNQLAAEVKSLEGQLATPSAIRVFTCEIAFGDPGASSSVLASDNNATDICPNDRGVDVTITSVACKNASGATTLLPILKIGRAHV